MTIPAEISKVIYESPYAQGDILPITFTYAEPEHVGLIMGSETELEYNVDYTVVGQNLTLNRNIPAGVTLTVYRTTPLNNEAEFPQEAPFDSEKISDAIDKLTMQNQEQAEAIDRALKLAINASGTTNIDFTKVNNLTPDAGKCLKWNAEETGIINSLYDPDVTYELAESRYQEIRGIADEAREAAEDAIEQVTIATEQASKATVEATKAQQLADEAQDAVLEAKELLQTAANFSMPAWEVRIDKTPGETYQAPGNGWIYIVNNPIDGVNYGAWALQFSKDGETWYDYPVKTQVPATGRDNDVICVPIPKGYWYKMSNAIYVVGYWYIPCIGATIKPEAGGNYIDAYTRKETDRLLANKMDNAALASPLVVRHLSTVPNNMSVTTTTGKTYLNRSAFDANLDATKTASEAENMKCTGTSVTIRGLLDPSNLIVNNSFPRINMQGHLGFIHNMSYGDIIMADYKMAENTSSSTVTPALNMVLGTLKPDYTFEPKIMINMESKTAAETTTIQSTYCTYIRQVQSWSKVGGNYGTGIQITVSPNFSAGNRKYSDSDSAKVIYYGTDQKGYVLPYESEELIPKGIYLRKYYHSATDANHVLALEFVYSYDSEDELYFTDYESKTIPLDVSLEDLELNCVLYTAIALNTYTQTTTKYSFDINKYFIAHKSPSNRIVSLGEVSEGRYMQVNHDPTSFTVENDRLTLLPATAQTLGGVKPDGTTLVMEPDGTLALSPEILTRIYYGDPSNVIRQYTAGSSGSSVETTAGTVTTDVTIIEE